MNMPREKVNFDYELVRIRIVSIFGSIKDFASVIGTSPCSISRKLNNSVAFTLEEIHTYSQLLGIEQNMIGTYWFTVKEKTNHVKSNHRK